MQAHSFYETVQKSRVTVQDVNENTEVRAGDEKSVFFLAFSRDRAELEVHKLTNSVHKHGVINKGQMQHQLLTVI